ncbi:Formylglycine-generating enzyme, required for sulfatase activity, contains SUMF1/FGE domain [Marivita hallyeonensis]|uniref:Formylglycine-generating enzyme, required for sulfatase activity, contains SUMF1/FGE domain n=1 Tax=Marivita hallyeonensis TaxID=996342 RepID=A0A1M5MXC5_9RHOB|nr:Formylglycine-generating enzyme, required for sulfatase activity, contains SUMF1/FGE domain [Marivita hallyeonensis]
MNASSTRFWPVTDGHCCAPSRPAGGTRDQTSSTVSTTGDVPELVRIPAGEFVMGTDDAEGYPEDGEGPPHLVALPAYDIAPTTVTNAEFARFVAATNHVTTAETLGSSFVFAGLLADDHPPTRAVRSAPWWREVEGACWRHPEGPESDIDDRSDHPVVHVSWTDAVAFCAWSGTRLPTEAEWECAARGGIAQARYPWGDDREPEGRHMMNVFQGQFPEQNTGDDGWIGPCPVRSFPPNGFGLYEMTGNVWEWCADWFSPHAYALSSPLNPQGPSTGENRVMRGGSYLCHDSYCNRYRVAARSANSPDSSAGNIGFRVARSA